MPVLGLSYAYLSNHRGAVHGIPDKGKTVRNKTVDREEIKLVENYLTYTELDSLDAYATKGTTGWVISCTAHNFHKYKKLFSKMIESFCIEDAED